MSRRKTAIVTGASQGIGAGVVNAFVERGFNVVANSRKVSESTEVAAAERVAFVDGHIGNPVTAASIVEKALSRFQAIDVLVNNAGIFFTKPFTDYTPDDFKSLVSTNLEGFLYVTQLAIKQMLAQKTGGSVVTITAALARSPGETQHGKECDKKERPAEPRPERTPGRKRVAGFELKVQVHVAGRVSDDDHKRPPTRIGQIEIGGLEEFVAGDSAGRGQTNLLGGVSTRRNLDIDQTIEDCLSCAGILNENAHVDGTRE